MRGQGKFRSWLASTGTGTKQSRNWSTAMNLLQYRRNDQGHSLIEERLRLYKILTLSFTNERGCLLFPEAPSGTGKIFAINFLLIKIHQMKRIAIEVKLSRITITLLSSRLTAPSYFERTLVLFKKEKECYNISRGYILQYSFLANPKNG